MARKLRRVERVEFSVETGGEIVAHMANLIVAGDGWINLVPKIADMDEKPTALGFFTLFGGGGTGVTMCTWIPGGDGRHGRTLPSLGITHVGGHRVVVELESLAVPVPPTWVVEQDHPRRGLVLRVPFEETNEHVLGWALRAVAGLSAPRSITGWHADVYLPTTS